MDWRHVGKRILGFVLGAGGVAVAVFVVSPWLEAPDQAAGGPQSRDAIMEGVLASFGEPEAGDEPESDGGANDAAGLTTIPLSSVVTAGESRAPVQRVATPEGVATWPLDGAPAQSFDLPVAAPAGAAAVTETEATAEATASEFEEDAEIWDEPVAADQPPGQAGAFEASVLEEAQRGVSIEAAEPMPFESIEAENGAPTSAASPQVVEASSQGEAKYATEAGPVRDMLPDPRSGKAFQRWIAPLDSSGAGQPRLEFEMPGDFRIVESPVPTEDTLPADEAVAATIERRPEFSTRHLIRSDAAPTVKGLPRSKAFGGAAPAKGLPRTSGSGKAAADDTGQSDPVTVPDTLRGVMGYRLPLVSRQELPDQVVSGVLIPAHTTYVILQPGYWELVGVAPGDVEALRATVEKAKADQQAVRSEPNARVWNPFRLFRRKQPPTGGD